MEQSIVLFRVADKDYGVPVEQVLSVEQGVQISQIPHTLSFIRGVFELREHVVPLVDMRERLGEEQRDPNLNAFVLVVQVDSVLAGFLVDEVSNVMAIETEQIEPAPTIVGGLEARFIHGLVRLADRVLVLLALPQLLADAEVRQLKQLEESRLAL